MAQSQWSHQAFMPVELGDPRVKQDAVHVRKAGLGLVAASIVLFGIGMVAEQGFVLLAGLVVFGLGLLHRRRERRRAVEALPATRGDALGDEIGRTSLRAVLSSPAVLILVLMSLVYVTLDYRVYLVSFVVLSLIRLGLVLLSRR